MRLLHLSVPNGNHEARLTEVLDEHEAPPEIVSIFQKESDLVLVKVMTKTHASTYRLYSK